MPPTAPLLQLEPESTLHFCKTPLASSPSRMLKLTNLYKGNVAFKVKTTAPKAYLVRPSSGTLRPREHQEVQIILQPHGIDGQANNHRFLVQAVVVPFGEPVSREQWGEFPKESIQELRLSVVLEEADVEPTANKAYGAAAAPLAGGGGGFGGGPPEQPGDLKVKYDELVQYTLMLEKEKKKLEDELAVLRGARGGKAGAGASAAEGYTKLHALLVALLVFFVSYAAKYLG